MSYLPRYASGTFNVCRYERPFNSLTMYPPSIIHSCCVLLIAASSKSRGNSTNSDEQRGNSTVRYDLFVNSMKDRDDKMQITLYNLGENSTKIDDGMHYESHVNSMNNDRKNSMQYEDIYFKNINILTICPSGLIHWCYIIREKYTNSDEQNDKSTTQYPLLINPMKGRDNKIRHRTKAYDLENVYKKNQMKYNTSVNISVIISTEKTKFKIFQYACFLVALLCLLLTFVVYSILPQLQNIHGYTLRVHVALLFIVNVIVICIQDFQLFPEQFPEEFPELKYCILLAYIYNFSAMSSFFWLNVICFDIWWTFRKFRSYRTNVKNREKKKFIMYSIYAWGITFILNVVCAIMDYAPVGRPNDLIQPEMCKRHFWFGRNDAMIIYFLIPVGVTVIVNICFFILTILTILHHDRHIAKELMDLESNRYYKTKRKFGIYLKLFLVMGISWILEIVLWSFDDDSLPSIVWDIADTIESLEGLIIFITYVWKKKIMWLLLKRFGWQDRNLDKVLKSNDCPNTASNTTSLRSISETVPMQNISLSNQQINHCADSYF